MSRSLALCALGAAVFPGCLALDWGNIGESSAVGPDDPPACGSPWTASGSIQLGSHVIDYSGGLVTVVATHKRDVDVVEDGCLGQLELRVAQAQGQCELKLVFSGGNGAEGGLVEARFSADSECPGFLDAQEGLYFSASGFAPWIVQGLPDSVSAHDTASLCQGDVRLGFPSRPFRLYPSSSSADVLTADLQDLVLSGGLLSQGDTSARCFEVSSCGAGWHDGGEGWCVEASQCSPGHSRTGSGECSP